MSDVKEADILCWFEIGKTRPKRDEMQCLIYSPDQDPPYRLVSARNLIKCTDAKYYAMIHHMNIEKKSTNNKE